MERPLYEVIYNPEEVTEDNFSGVFAVSLVSNNAIGFDWIRLSEEKEEVLLKASTDGDKRLLVGPVLIPNQKIFRKAGGGKDIVFKREIIEMVSQDFFKNGYHTNLRIEHEGGFIDGLAFVQSWLIEDSKIDKSAVYGYDLPEGTWMMACLCDEETWNDFVLTGKVTGFSIDGYFATKKIDELLLKCETVENNNKNNKANMTKKNVKKTSLVQKAIKTVTTFFVGEEGTEMDYITIEVEGIGKVMAENFDEGSEVFYELDGQPALLVEGVFVNEGKEYKTDAEGKIISIVDAPAEAAVTTDTEAPVTEVSAETEAAPADEDKAKRIKELEDELAALKGEKVEMSDDVSLWEYEAEDGNKYYAEWLGDGQIVTDENKDIVADSEFSWMGTIYSTDSEGKIIGSKKNVDSPFWRKDREPEVKVEVVETTELKKQIEDLQTQLKTKDAEIVSLKEEPATAKAPIVLKSQADLATMRPVDKFRYLKQINN